MPRFLDTTTGRYVWIDDPSSVRYAILSHTWRREADGGEQSYTNIRELQTEVDETVPQVIALPPTASSGPSIESPCTSILDHPRLSAKIKNICKVAREAGYKLVWVDSACIDKTSSAELSEAINSMYEWYRLADVCYAYLADVPDDGVPPTAPTSTFRKSYWHRRGWTLQELIAPGHVVFLTCTWKFLGTKIGLASTLQIITGIQFSILVGRDSVFSISISKRLGWAALRYTTRVEDEAYSLMGLFDVHMPPIYGEGRKAFLRLQEEIIKTSPDQSIFAWGSTCTLKALGTAQNRNTTSPEGLPEQGLLASSAREYRYTRNISPLPPSRFLSLLQRTESEISLPHCVFTPHGVRIKLPCIDLTSLPEVSNAISRPFLNVGHATGCSVPPSRARYLALLRCESFDGCLIALALCHPDSRRTAQNSQALAVGSHLSCGVPYHRPPFRVVYIPADVLPLLLPHLSPASKIVILRDYPVPAYRPARIGPFSPSIFASATALSVAPWCVLELSSLGVSVSPVQFELLDAPEGELQAAFSLVLSRGPASPNREHGQVPREDLGRQIKLTLEIIGRVLGEEESRAIWITRTRVLVENTFLVASPCSGSDTDAAASDRPHPETLRDPKAPYMRTLAWRSSSVELLNAQADVHIRGDTVWTGVDRALLQLLRLTLKAERPPGWYEFNGLSLSMELSDYYYPGNLKASQAKPSPGAQAVGGAVAVTESVGERSSPEAEAMKGSSIATVTMEGEPNSKMEDADLISFATSQDHREEALLVPLPDETEEELMGYNLS
ncbi:hypothetical protein C2E23DRAFT_886801 [Lenzites betulinus]|nr:hypothetical protein C2E23DRAFT_886801 [Lenzites betulinus]